MLTASHSSWTPGRAGGAFRGTIDDITERGTHTSGTQIWRCFHHHRLEAAALSCAQRELAKILSQAEGDR